MKVGTWARIRTVTGLDNAGELRRVVFGPRRIGGEDFWCLQEVYPVHEMTVCRQRGQLKWWPAHYLEDAEAPEWGAWYVQSSQ